MKGKIVLFCLFAINFSIAQNLVLNPSFEELLSNSFKGGFSTNHTDLTNFIKYWSSPNKATPDIHFNNLKPQDPCWYQSEIAHTGNVSLGFISYSPETDYSNVSDYHEHIQGQLSEALLVDSIYTMAFWVKNVPLCYDREAKIPIFKYCFNNNIGVHFTERLFTNHAMRNLKPDLNIEEIVDTKGQWERHKFIFKATKNAKFFQIGNFFKDSETAVCPQCMKNPKINDTSVLRQSYYYIDDILIKSASVQEKISYKIDHSETIVLQSKNFDNNRFTLIDENLAELETIAAHLGNIKDYKVIISGHTDSVGGFDYNKKLSLKRANYIKQILVSKKIPDTNIICNGYGFTVPIADNQSAEKRLMNRRVEIKIDLKSNKNYESPYKLSIKATHQEEYIYTQNIKGIYELPCTLALDSLSDKERTLIRNSTIKDAAKYIDSMVNTNNIVFVNEHHKIPATRVFFNALLPMFKAKGFNNLFIEQLDANDTLLNLRGFPQRFTGYYFGDPAMANIVRDASLLDMNLMPFDVTEDEIMKVNRDSLLAGDTLMSGITIFNTDGEDISGFENMSVRDYLMARNIANFVMANPKEKVLVYTGHGHVKEYQSVTWKPMGYWFRQMTGLNPLTIEQADKSNFCEYLNLSRSLNQKAPFVLINKSDSCVVEEEFNPFELDKHIKQTDIQVYHPLPSYIAGRANWIYYVKDKIKFKIDNLLQDFEYPCLVIAYSPKEGKEENRIPVDIVEINTESEKNRTLWLRKGDYQLVFSGLTKTKKVNITVK